MPEFKYKHGLSIMRAQPFHIGHAKMIDKMLRECEQVTIVLGSIQEQGTERNPLNYTTRKKMIQNVYRNRPEYPRLKIIGLFDINNPAEWAEYVLDFMNESLPQLGRPDVYYAVRMTPIGSETLLTILRLKIAPIRIFRLLPEPWCAI